MTDSEARLFTRTRPQAASSTNLVIALLASFAIGCGAVSKPVRTATARADGAVHVRVEGPNSVELWQADGSAKRVCAAPCERDVQAKGARFEARVIDLPDSPTFDLPPSPKGLVLKVEPAPRVLLGLGAVTGTVGGAVMIIGGAIALGDALGGNSDLEGAALGGGITAAIGSAVLAAGIVLAALSGTRVNIREAMREPLTVQF